MKLLTGPRSGLGGVVILFAALLIMSCCFQQVTAFICYGVDASNPMVCGGKGRCIFDDFCECQIGAMGSNCTEIDCGWMQDSMGAPQPAVNAVIIKGNRVFIDVLMAKRAGVTHRIGFRENLFCNANDPKIVPNSKWTLVETNSCFVRYNLNITLQDHLNDPEIVKKFGDGDVFQAISSIYASYFDFSDGQGCKLTTFKTEWVINIYLQAVSTATFGGTNDPIGKMRQDTIRVLDDGRLQIIATLTMSTSGELSNFGFVSSTVPGVTLMINASLMDYDCGQEGQPFCKYWLYIETDTQKNDYSGKYVIGSDLTRNTDTFRVDITFLLQYATPVPPAATNVNLTTKSSFYSADFGAPKTVFSTIDDAWLLTEIVEKISVPTRALAYKNVYLCCMEDRGPMPEYDPAVGKYGCTKQSAGMTVWAALVSAEQPLVARYNSKLKKLPFIDDKIGMSFNLLPLIGENRLCYVHVESFLKAKTRRSSMSLTISGTRSNLAEDDASINSFMPFQIVPAAVKAAAPAASVRPIASPVLAVQKPQTVVPKSAAPTTTAAGHLLLVTLVASILAVLFM